LHPLWLEYRESFPVGYGYTQVCHYYISAMAKAEVVLCQEDRAGEKLFTDYAGDALKLTRPATGDVTPVCIFVAVLVASNRAYVAVLSRCGCVLSPVAYMCIFYEVSPMTKSHPVHYYRMPSPSSTRPPYCAFPPSHCYLLPATCSLLPVNKI
jgi:hypothetical protein